MIKYQRPPRIPPISFFEPISVDPNDMMTDVEFLLGVLKKLNETIAQVNSNTKFIDEYSGKIEEIEAEIKALRLEMEQFEDDISAELLQQFNTLKLMRTRMQELHNLNNKFKKSLLVILPCMILPQAF